MQMTSKSQSGIGQDQTVNTLVIAGHIISVTTIRLHHFSGNQLQIKQMGLVLFQ